MNTLRVTSCLGVVLLLSACGATDKSSAPISRQATSQGMANQVAGQSNGQSNGQSKGMSAGRVTSVLTQTTKLSSLTDETEALGTAKANESVDLTAKATNRVVAIHFSEGQYVKAGAVLVEFDGAEARANLASAQATLRDTQSQYQRSRELFQSKALSESDLMQLEAKMLAAQAAVDAAKARVNDTLITAPFGGRMGLRSVSVGALVTPGAVIGTLDDIGVIKLDFSVPETYLSSVHEGQALQAKSSAYPDDTFTGRVSSIATRVDPVSRSVVVRALIDNRHQRLKPGMFMTVHLLKQNQRALMIPEQALVPEGDQQYVFVVTADKVRKVAITLGRRKPGQVEVVAGLSAGTEIVVEGGEKLRDGATVKVQGAAATRG